MSARRNQNGFNPQDVNRAVQAFARLDRRAQAAIVVLLLVVGVIAAVVYLRSAGHQGPTPTQVPPPAPSTAPIADLGDPLLLGNPSDAVADPAARDNYLLARPAYALSWNDTKGTANWVSWRTVRSNFGDGDRAKNFSPDPALPKGFKVIGHGDYEYAKFGFDRGHLCPNSDRDLSTELAAITFYTTNIVPQAPRSNQKAWNHLEQYARNLASRKNQRLYTVAGPLGRGGEGVHGRWEAIGPKAVVVPAQTWKVIVAVPDAGGPDDPLAITTDARVIAVLVPNDQTVGEPWAGYRVSPAEIERRTGYTFFDRLRPEVAEVLRQKVDAEHVQPPQPYRPGNRGGQAE